MTDELNCPRCQSIMQRSDAIDGVLAGCPRCGGLFVDNHAGALIVSGPLSDEASAFVSALDARDVAVSGAGAYRTTNVSEVAACPMCRQPMRGQRVGDVELDTCDADGTFFDRRELRALLFSRAEAQAQRQTQANRRVAETERQAESFHFDVREPDEPLQRRHPEVVLLRKLLRQLALFVRR